MERDEQYIGKILNRVDSIALMGPLRFPRYNLKRQAASGATAGSDNYFLAATKGETCPRSARA